MADVIQIRRDTAANWASVNPVLHQGEEGLETDTGRRKTGDGATAWNSLGYSLAPLSSTPSAGKVMVWPDSTGYIPASNSNITGNDLFAIGKVGKFMGASVTNAPDAGWWYFDIDIHIKGVYEHYTARAVTRVDAYGGWLINGVWSGWGALQ